LKPNQKKPTNYEKTDVKVMDFRKQSEERRIAAGELSD